MLDTAGSVWRLARRASWRPSASDESLELESGRFLVLTPRVLGKACLRSCSEAHWKSWSSRQQPGFVAVYLSTISVFPVQAIRHPLVTCVAEPKAPGHTLELPSSSGIRPSMLANACSTLGIASPSLATGPTMPIGLFGMVPSSFNIEERIGAGVRGVLVDC